MKKLTIKDAKAQAKAIGFTIRRNDLGEFEVYPLGGGDKYFTYCLKDALGTAKVMARDSVIAELKEACKGDFMLPEMFKGEDIEFALMGSGLDVEPNGVYCRLSASGYLDCTEWNGPFESVKDAAQDMLDTYYS